MSELKKEEQLIYDAIVSCDRRITQLQLARSCFVGCHEKFENYNTPKESTLRKVRQIVRDLIMNHGLFIGSDEEGYYIIKTYEQKKEYMNRFEKQARSSAKSYMQRYEVMSKNLGIKSKFFEDLVGKKKRDAHIPDNIQINSIFN